METSLLQLCESFISTRDIIKNEFKYDGAYMPPVCSFVFCSENKTPDTEALKKCKQLIKDETSSFSNFRSTAKSAIISMLAVDPSPETRLRNALTAHDLLKDHFFASPFLPLAAMIISANSKVEEFESIVDKIGVIYKLMKEEHPILTSSDDSVFIALLAYTDLKPKDIIIETERCYSRLGKTFLAGDAYQALSHVLALYSEKADVKCDKVNNLKSALKNAGLNIGNSYELPILGSLAMLPQDIEKTVADIGEVSEYLSKQKGYGFFGVPIRQRLLHASIITSLNAMKQGNNDIVINSAIGSTVSLIIAQQTAILAAVTASVAATNAANSAT